MIKENQKEVGNLKRLGRMLIIALKNGWPFIVTIIIALVLIMSLETGHAFIDAYRWPAYDKIANHQDHITYNSDGKELKPPTLTQEEDLHNK